MTKLSVNINKIAVIRNSRGANVPDVLKVAIDCERFGSEGITVHPRPDERHIRFADVRALKSLVTTEFNIEGYPASAFIDLVKEVKPHQVTLVPDPPHVLTSNAGWDTKANEQQLKELIDQIHSWGVRTSIFVDTNLQNIEYAAKTGVNRVEFYTGPYAEQFSSGKEKAIEPYVIAAKRALELGLELNAGHDLNQENLRFFKQAIPELAEVSIGHALISDALYLGLENTIQRYIYLLR